MANQRRGGIIQIQTNGTIVEAAGDFTYNLGGFVREALMGPDGTVQGFKESVKQAFLEGDIRDSDELDVAQLKALRDATITLKVANGKTIMFPRSFAAGDWDQGTAEGTISARFEGPPAEEIK